MSDSATLWTVIYQATLSVGFSRQEYWSGLPTLLQGIFPTQGSNPSLVSSTGRQVLYQSLAKPLLLLSCFSRVRLWATPQTAAHQASLSLGFSRQEHWSGLPFPSPTRESEVAQSCLTLSDPMDCSLPVSSIHGIFQARVLELGAIAFSADHLLAVSI